MRGLGYLLRLWQNPYVKKTAKGSAVVFTMAMLAAVLGYAIRVILSRQLSLEDFGLFYAVFTFIMFFGVFKDLGLKQALIKFIPEFKVKKKYGEIRASMLFVLLINLASAILIAVVFILLSNFLAINYFNNIQASKLVIILSVYFIISVFSDVFSIICLGFQRNLLYSLKLLIINIVVLAGIFIFKDLGIFAPAISYLIAAFMAGIIYFFFFRISAKLPKCKSKFSSKLYKKLFLFGIPITLTIMGSMVIGYIDVLMLTFFRTLEEVGVYSAVLPSALLFSTIGGSVGAVLLPVVSEMFAKKKHSSVRRGLRLINSLLSAVLIPLTVLVFIFSDKIIALLFGSDFSSGDLPLKILIIGAAFNALFLVSSKVVIAKGRPEAITKVIISATILNIVVNLVLIPVYGLIGAAIATSLSYLVQYVLISFMLRKYL